MSKYGLNLRPNKNKPPSKPPLPTPFGFGNDDDNDVEREISRHASKNKSLKDVNTCPTPIFELLVFFTLKFLVFHVGLMLSFVFWSCLKDWGAAKKSLGRGPLCVWLWWSLWWNEKGSYPTSGAGSPRKKGTFHTFSKDVIGWYLEVNMYFGNGWHF